MCTLKFTQVINLSATHIKIMDISVQKCHGIISRQANWRERFRCPALRQKEEINTTIAAENVYKT